MIHDLIGIKDAPIEEHMVECVCELLETIGHSLDSAKHDKELVEESSQRLMNLKNAVDPATGKSLFSKRMQFKIQDLIDLRGRSWVRKPFKELAKTKDEVRNDAATQAKTKDELRNDAAKGAHKTARPGSTP
jgi:hypothetical protein